MDKSICSFAEWINVANIQTFEGHYGCSQSEVRNMNNLKAEKREGPISSSFDCIKTEK